MNPTHNLRIECPCPFVPTRLNKDGNNYFCKSCSKSIIDFRNKTPEEIRSGLTANTCGIFTVEQLPGQQPMKWSRQLMLYCFTILSFLGFSIKPLAAQTTQPGKDTIQVDMNAVKKDNIKTDNETTIKLTSAKAEHKGLFRKKKKSKRLTGCPVF